MELGSKGLAAIAIPALITALAGLADNAMKWRAEMQQKEFDRQTRILDKIIETPAADQRIAIANFYLGTGSFTGKYKVELERAVDVAEEIQKRNAKASVEKTAAKVEKLKEELASAPKEALEEKLPPDENPEIYSTPTPPPEVPIPVPRFKELSSQVAALAEELRSGEIRATQSLQEAQIPETIFSFDKSSTSSIPNIR